MSVVDFLLPSPLRRPDLWPKPKFSNQAWLLPLDLATVSGGALRAHLEEINERCEVFWVLSRVFLGSGVSHEIRLREADDWIKKNSRSKLLAGPGVSPLLAVGSLGRELELVDSFSVSPPGLFNWAKEIYPSVLTEIGELKLKSHLNDYEKAMPEAGDFPWEGLRFFSGFLRQRRQNSLAAAAARDWAYLQALYSPQEERTIHGGQRVMLNPTLQIVKLDAVELFFRVAGQVQTKTVDWIEGYLIDEVSEAPRTSIHQLLEHAENERSNLERTLGSVGSSAFSDALEGLIQLKVFVRC